MRIVLTSLLAAAAVASSLILSGCSGSQDPADDAVASEALVAPSDAAGPTTEPVDGDPTDAPTTLPSTDRVTVSIRFVAPPSEQTLESLEVLGVIFAERDGERIAVGPVYTATVPEGMIEALEATAEIADVEVSGQRPIILPDRP